MTLVRSEIMRAENPKFKRCSGKGEPDLCSLQYQQCDSSLPKTWSVQGSILRTSKRWPIAKSPRIRGEKAS